MQKDLITKPIVLIGVVGSGKSTIGKKLANKLRLKFYDSDRMVEAMEDACMVDIHEFKGKVYFHKKEAEVIKNVLEYGGVVLSTGGMAYMNPELRALIKEKGITVWLRADIDVLHQRVSRRNTRPDLNVENKKEIIQKMMDQCYKVYAEADIIIESANDEVYYIVDTLLMRLKKFIGANKGS